MAMNRREFLHVMGMAAAAGMLPTMARAGKEADMYKMPRFGQVRIMHITDTHAQLKPIYFREPNVNLGMGAAFGKLPHVVGEKMLKELKIKPNSIEAHAFTYLNFTDAARQYGKVGGFAHVKTLVDSLREQAGGRQNTLLIDGGDTWHGSATALWTRGADMVEACNILGVDYMTPHWEFTYTQEEVFRNLSKYKGKMLAQNCLIREDSLMGDDYAALTKKYGGIGLHSEDTRHAFAPYAIKDVSGFKVAVIGQAFPRMANANPRANFPDLTFGVNEEEMQKTVNHIREKEKPAAVIVISHNGMDVDIKLASRVTGIDAIFGGHTHDGVPVPVKVKNKSGTTLVTNGGSNGKFVGVMDLDIKAGKVAGVQYKLLPVFSNILPADKEMETYINTMRQTKYDDKVIEGRRPDNAVNKDRLGKTYESLLSEVVGVAGETLYRRGNFMGTWDQVIVNALREEHDTQIALSAGVRWGTSVLAGDNITFENVMDETSMTYGETYRTEMTGEQLREAMEGIADNLFVEDPYLQSGGDMVRIGGLTYDIDPTQPLGKRISNVRLDNDTPVEAGKSYTVSGWAQVDSVGSGRLIHDVVADYIRKHKEVKLSKVNHPRLKGVKNNPGVENYASPLL
jgi:S-sulfosulfanyl-L-cysteine sulfohydrolase